MQDLPRSLSPLRRGMMVADITGNLQRIGDSVILNIDDSSSAANSSSSDCEVLDRGDSQDVEDELEDDDDDGREENNNDEDDDDEEEEELHCDDWEIRMLAAEMERREHSLAETAASCSDDNAGNLRRRRKRSDTEDTEQSEHEPERTHRPRASSLDQHHNNSGSRRGRGFFKAMSFDRDKDRL